jgi:hypothetical protein
MAFGEVDLALDLAVFLPAGIGDGRRENLAQMSASLRSDPAYSRRVMGLLRVGCFRSRIAWNEG